MRKEMKFVLQSVTGEQKASRQPVKRGQEASWNQKAAWGQKVANRVSALATVAVLAIRYPYAFFAFEVPTVNSATLSTKFSDPNQIMGIVVGLALWICQMVGVGMFIWGIYGYVTARKDGEAEAMNGALGKLISGAVLIGMKGVLKILGIVS